MSNEITNEKYMISYEFQRGEQPRCKVVPHPPPEGYYYETSSYTTGWCYSAWEKLISGEIELGPEAGGHHGMLLAAIACDLMIQGMPAEEIMREFGKIPVFRERMESVVMSSYGFPRENLLWHPENGRFLTLEKLKDADREIQIAVMRHRFLELYEDPAHRTSYSTKEGGYIYTQGGPYDAHDELGALFGEYVPEDVIEELVENLEQECIEWAPKP